MAKLLQQNLFHIGLGDGHRLLLDHRVGTGTHRVYVHPHDRGGRNTQNHHRDQHLQQGKTGVEGNPWRCKASR